MLKLLLKDIAIRENLSVQSNTSLRNSIKLMNINRKGVVVVLEDKRLAGILTERDIIKILYEGINLDESVDKYAKKTLVSTKGCRTVGYALNLTIDNKIRRVIVTDDSNNFIGLVTQQDLLKYVEEDFYRLSIKVKHILKDAGSLISVSSDDPLINALKKMIENKISAVVVMEDRAVVGIITEKDILKLAGDNISLENMVDKYMSSPVETVCNDSPLVEIVEVMNYKNIRRVLIVDQEGREIGILTIRDVIKNLEGDYSKFLERKLRNAREILNLLPEMLIEIADTGKEQLIVWANSKVIEKFGKEILDKSVADFLQRKNWNKIYDTLNKLTKVENIRLKKDNRIYELSGFLLRIDGRIEKRRYQLIIRDITEEVRLSTFDPLTNIYNRRFINGFMIQEIERSKRSYKKFSIVICDIDDFKKINDIHGHLSGDIVLKSVSQLITNTIRHLDVVGRYGGDEFMIILPEASGQTASHIVDRIRFNIGSLEIPVLKNKKVKVTASFGIATFPEDGISPDDLLIASDERLYKTKSSGKNKVFYN